MPGEIEEKRLKEQLLKLLKEKNVIKFGKFILSSGKESDYYVDIKKAITDPRILDLIAELIKLCIGGKIDKIAGPELGAVPIVAAVSLKTQTPFIIIRKERKGHGISRLIEGELNNGETVLMVEDVTTTGKSILKAIKVIEEHGGEVKRVFVVVDREEGARENLQEGGFILEPLISISELKK